MPLFMCIMNWKKEDNITVIKKNIEAMQKVPEGITLCCGYIGECEGWGVLEAKSKEQATDFLTRNVPEMKTEVKQVLQFYPPSPDLYAVIYSMTT